MPSQAPRNNADKKRAQLLQRERELKHALRSKFDMGKLVCAAENLRSAHLSLLKAQLHWTQDSKMRGRSVEEQVIKIQDGIQEWLQKPIEVILNDESRHPDKC